MATTANPRLVQEMGKAMKENLNPKNRYHIISFVPIVEKEGMLVDLEDLAERLVASGQLRIDTGTMQNFIRLTLPRQRVSIAVSHRQMHDAKLLPKIEALLYQTMGNAAQAKKAKAWVHDALKKTVPVPLFLEKQLARLLVQAAHPAVIGLMILEGVEIFISYDYTVGDMLDVISWQQVGESSGLQSTEAKKTAVFVATGGDPFGEQEEKGRVYGDGWPALAQCLIIAAQEIGHYSDLKRDSRGRIIGRYSSDIYGRWPDPEVEACRQKDKATVAQFWSQCRHPRLERLIRLERELHYARRFRNRWLQRFFWRCLHAWMFWRLDVSVLPLVGDLRRYRYPLTQWQWIISDMAFNLEPKADAYVGENASATAAIACAEALARVPQQVVKWGHAATRLMMPSLYRFYYERVIPDVIATYETIHQAPYHFSFVTIRQPWWTGIWRWVRRKKPLVPSSLPSYDPF
jgi:hypothetical protein